MESGLGIGKSRVDDVILPIPCVTGGLVAPINRGKVAESPLIMQTPVAQQIGTVEISEVGGKTTKTK